MFKMECYPNPWCNTTGGIPPPGWKIESDSLFFAGVLQSINLNMLRCVYIFFQRWSNFVQLFFFQQSRWWAKCVCYVDVSNGWWHQTLFSRRCYENLCYSLFVFSQKMDNHWFGLSLWKRKIQLLFLHRIILFAKGLVLTIFGEPHHP